MTALRVISAVVGFISALVGLVAFFTGATTWVQLKNSVRGDGAVSISSRDEGLSDTYGVLAVTSHPDGASVRFDKKEIGSTPVDGYEAAPGRHRVDVQKSGYRSEVVGVRVRAGAVTQLRIELYENTMEGLQRRHSDEQEERGQIAGKLVAAVIISLTLGIFLWPLIVGVHRALSRQDYDELVHTLVLVVVGLGTAGCAGIVSWTVLRIGFVESTWSGVAIGAVLGPIVMLFGKLMHDADNRR